MTFREFTGKNVEEAIRAAMAEFSADLSDLDIEILGQGSRGILGVGGEEARILAAPKSAVAAADTVRVEAPAAPPSRSSRRTAVPVEEPSEADDEAIAESAPDAVVEDLTEAPIDTDAQSAELATTETARRSRGGRGRGG
ncbi:MAG TPA: Jag N-terminal domain-containing protein, partial [Candidatus Limnocylindria bacterium]|nr:Jag N-terminal domain-containing protein [Candidatus Limnocylindria bacterium]